MSRSEVQADGARWRASPRAALALVVLVVAGCEVPPAEELIRFKIGDTALVDIACDPESGECQGDEVVDGVLDYKAALSVTQLSAEFLQYEVTYDLGDYASPPAFASPTEITAISGTVRRFSLRAAGIEQRDWMAAYYPQESIVGTATMTLYGYDHKDQIVSVKTKFDVKFADFTGGGDTTAGAR
ncbi:MAG: hypothetical protein R3F59_35815 [Myxococcota bacterium]